MDNLSKSFEALESLKVAFSKIKIPEVNTEMLKDINIPRIDVSAFDRDVVNFKNPLIELAEEQNDYLRDLVKYNEDISRYNKELAGLNEKILKKINSLDDTLTFLNLAFSDKAENDGRNSEQQLSLLVQLIDIIESKDSGKLQKFMSEAGAPVAVGLLVEYLKIKFGLG